MIGPDDDGMPTEVDLHQSQVAFDVLILPELAGLGANHSCSIVDEAGVLSSAVGIRRGSHALRE